MVAQLVQYVKIRGNDRSLGQQESDANLRNIMLKYYYM